ncbi:MAG: response regulator, partial [Flavobacteriales bacterium]|nr:response regulator [Flavobacteriales bacterium]
MNALIVDDEEFARENLKMLLEEFCPDVLVTGTAASARDARHQVEDFNPDLVFLDIMMPGEDGFSFLHSLDD